MCINALDICINLLASFTCICYMIYAIEMTNCHWYSFYNFRCSFNVLKGRTLTFQQPRVYLPTLCARGPLLPIENAFASELSERILLYSRSREASPRPMSTYGILQVSRTIHCFLIILSVNIWHVRYAIIPPTWPSG